MADILLIAPGCAASRSDLFFPLGIAYVSSYLKAYGYNVDCLNLNHYPSGIHQDMVHDALEKQAYQYVGLGALSVFLKELTRVVGYVREVQPDMDIVIGGGAVTADPQTVFDLLEPAYGILGEGEETALELTRFLFEHNDESPEGIAGLAYRRDGRLVMTEKRKPSVHIDDYPYPDMEGMGISEYMNARLNDKTTYHLSTRPVLDVPICASRSCPYPCTFCFHPLGDIYRERSNASIIDEIVAMMDRYHPQRLTIYAELFASNREKLRDFCNRLLSLEKPIKWSAQLRVDQLDEDILVCMKQAGCDFVSLGFESGSPEVLRSMRKKIKAEQIEKAVHAVRRVGLGLQANFLYGDPAETPQTVAETNDLKKRCRLHFVSWTKVVPYPGTALYQECRKRGLINDPLDFTLRLQDGFDLNMTSMPDDQYHQIWTELFDLNERHRRERTANVISSRRTGQTCSEVIAECPSCQSVNKWIVHYPPEGDHCGLRIQFPAGIKGIVTLCEACNRKMYVLPWMLAHISPVYQAYQEEIDKAKTTRVASFVTPCIQKIDLFQDLGIDLSGLHLAAALDNDPKKAGQFLGAPVCPRETGSLQPYRPRRVFVLPSPYWKEISHELLGLGWTRDEIVCWDALVVQALEMDERRRQEEDRDRVNRLAHDRGDGVLVKGQAHRFFSSVE
jgi:radical SAM superfamily enzyme YgiQ (UPF0313 family)